VNRPARCRPCSGNRTIKYDPRAETRFRREAAEVNVIDNVAGKRVDSGAGIAAGAVPIDAWAGTSAMRARWSFAGIPRLP